MPSPLLPGGILPPGEPTIDVAKEAAANPPTVLVATPSTKPINPAAVGIIKGRQPKAATAEAGFEGLEEVKGAAAEAGFEGLQEVKGGAEPGFEGLKEADKLDVGDSKSLLDDETFHPGQYLSENPGVAQDPEKIQKLLDVYRARRARGLQVGKVAKEAVSAAPGILAKTAKGARDLAERAIELGIQPAVNAIANKLTGDTEEQQAAISAEQGKEQLKAAAEITAGTESAITGLAQLAQQGGRKISHLFGKPVDKLTDSELLNELYVDSQFHQTLQDVASGKGDVAKAAGLDSEFLAKNGVNLDPSAIENLSLVDPVTLLATAGAFKVVGVGGKILATAATRAGGEAVVNALKTAAAKSIQVAGRGIELTGKGVQNVPLRTASAVGIGGQLAAGNVGGAVVSAVAPAAVKAGGRALEAAGQAIKGAGEALQPGFVGPVSAGVQRISQIAASPVGQVAGAAARGAVQGVVTAAPLAAATDESQTAGALLGGGAILGAVHGGVSEALPAAKRAVAETVAKNYLDPNKIPFSPVESPGYGVDANLDAQHAAAIQNLAPEQAAAVNNFREALRGVGGEIYVQDAQSYLQRITDQLKADRGVTELSPEDQQRAQAYADTHAQFDGTIVDANGQPRRVVFLNSDAKGLPHDAGHLFQALLSPERQQALRDSVLSNYTPEQLNQFANAYANLLGDKTYFSRLGEAASKQKIADEIIAENFSQIFGNTNLSGLKAPKGFLDSLKQTALNVAETLGIDLSAGRTTPDLNVAPSYRLQGVLRNAARDVLNAPESPKAAPFLKQGELPIEPAKPAEPVKPTDIVSPETPVSPRGEIVPESKPAAAPNAAAQRAAVTGIDVATQLATSYSPEIQGTIKTISDSMQAGNPVLEIEHRGIISEPGQPRETGRTVRRAEQAKGYEELARIQAENRENVPAGIVDVHQKTFVPVRWVEQGGKPTLIAMSLDKVISNIRRVVADAASKKAESLIPYETENGQLTEKGWNDAIADLQAYAENQSNGYRGDGGKLVRPEAEVGVSIPAENPNFSPKTLSPEASDFANLVQGLNPPETARIIKGQIPGNVKGQIVAEINARKPQPLSVIKPEHIGKQEFKGLGRTVKETNPLRNELAARGVKVRNLTEVTERIAAPDIASVKPRTDISFKAPVTDVIRGGFLPVDRPVSDVVNDVFQKSAEDWAKAFGPQATLTKSAYELGLKLKTPEDLQALKTAQQQASDLSKAAMERVRAGDMAALDEVGSLATKTQFFREAVEAATDTGSAGNPRMGWRKYFPEASPPFSEALAKTLQARYGGMERGFTDSEKFGLPTEAESKPFLPRTEKGREALEKGYDTELTGPVGRRAISIKKDGVVVGELVSTSTAPGEAYIKSASLKREHRGKGVAEAAYRELLTQLKEDGVKEVVGDVVAQQPLGIRRKIFGDENTTVSDERGQVPIDQAIQELGEGALGFEARSRITPEMSFLPSDKAITDALSADKKEFVGKARDLEPGTPVGLRIDIPAYNRTGTFVITVHDKAKGGAVGKRIGYDSIATVDNPTFFSNEKGAEKIREGAAKFAIATVEGEFNPAREIPEGKEWTKVGFNPTKHSYFYEKGTEKPVVSGDQAVSAGNTVYVKNPVYGNREDFAFLPTKGEADTILKEIQAASPDGNFKLVGSVAKGKTGAKDIDFSVNYGTGVIESEMGHFYHKVVPALEKNGWTIHNDSVRDYAGEPPGWVLTTTSPRGDSVEFFFNGEAIEAAPNSYPGQRAFLPKPGTPEYNAYVTDRIEESKKKFPEALPLEVNKDAEGNFKAGYKDEPNWVNPPWAFNDTPLAKANRVEGDAVASENKYTDALAKKLEASYHEAKKDPGVEAGETWYSVAREKLQTLLGKDAQLFAELLGATSPNTAVDVNFGYALEAYNLFKQGFYDKILEKYREGKTKFEAGETEEFSKETGKTGKKVTERAFLSWWADKHDLNPTSNRQKPDGSYIKFGMHTGGVLRVLDRSWLQTVEGPKTPNFTGNLSGASFEATIDKWAARLVHRLSNEGLTEGKPWRILPPAETGVADRDFFTAQKAFRKAGDALGVSPDALQAILWFMEKQHWDKNGWTTTTGAAKADYNVLLQLTKKNDEGKLIFEKPAKVKKVKAEDIAAKKPVDKTLSANDIE